MGVLNLTAGVPEIDLAPNPYRVELRQRADTRGLYEAALTNAERAIAAAVERQAEALKQHAHELAGLRAERDRAAKALADATAAERGLIAHAPKDRRARYAEAIADLQRAESKAGEIRDQIARLQVVMKRTVPEEQQTDLNRFGGERKGRAVDSLEESQRRAMYRIGQLEHELERLNLPRLRKAVADAEAALSMP